MKITVIHGENTPSSLMFVEETIENFKKRGIPLLRISQESGLNSLETLTAGELFEKESLFLLEEANKVTAKDCQWLSKNSEKLTGNLLIYSDSQLPFSLINKLSSFSEVKEFKLPKSLFVFLDSILPKQNARSIKLMHQLLKKEPPEFIFAVIGKLIRDLYWVKVAPETLDYPGWRLAKLKRQAKGFSQEKLKKALNSVAKIDMFAKTSSYDLGSSLDLLMVSLLQ
jgi:hypothetical protein